MNKAITARGNEEEAQCEEVNTQNSKRIRGSSNKPGPKEPQRPLSPILKFTIQVISAQRSNDSSNVTQPICVTNTY